MYMYILAMLPFTLHSTGLASDWASLHLFRPECLSICNLHLEPIVFEHITFDARYTMDDLV
jgi:hypothetical protein